ncbi:hypothetical protein CSE899_03711 [Cronobacter sakazakii E899]|nr:hypothetical protein CSE899_03711 [Cronobacter sakazakii E899]
MYGWHQYLAVIDYRGSGCSAFWHQKLRSLGSDLGESIKGFKKAMGDDDKQNHQQDADFTAPSAQDKQIGETKSDVTADDAKKRDKEQV